MKKFKHQTLTEYLKRLSSREPIPGGGSAASLAGALGAGLLSMVANYSLGKGKPRSVEKKIKAVVKKSTIIRDALLDIVDRDAQAYLRVVKTRRAAPKIKEASRKKAAAVPLEACRLCYEAMALAPFLVKEGNRYLLSDVKVAVELLLAAYQGAKINVEINQ